MSVIDGERDEHAPRVAAVLIACGRRGRRRVRRAVHGDGGDLETGHAVTARRTLTTSRNESADCPGVHVSVMRIARAPMARAGFAAVDPSFFRLSSDRPRKKPVPADAGGAQAQATIEDQQQRGARNPVRSCSPARWASRELRVPPGRVAQVALDDHGERGVSSTFFGSRTAAGRRRNQPGGELVALVDLAAATGALYEVDVQVGAAFVQKSFAEGQPALVAGSTIVGVRT